MQSLEQLIDGPFLKERIVLIASLEFLGVRVDEHGLSRFAILKIKKTHRGDFLLEGILDVYRDDIMFSAQYFKGLFITFIDEIGNQENYGGSSQNLVEILKGL